jgi:universal stress protein F
MYSHILVPVDPGHAELGPHILKRARHLVGSGGRITLLTVLEPLPGYVANYIPRETVDRSRHEARESLEELVRASGIDAEVVLRVGNPPNEILSEAQERGCDAIVLGSHRPDYRDYFIGSTAARVVRHARCSVLVERSGPLAPAEGPAQG